MSDKLHPCPASACDEMVPLRVLACKVHWFSLPIELRRIIARNWREQNLSEHARYRKVATYLLNGGKL